MLRAIATVAVFLQTTHVEPCLCQSAAVIAYIAQVTAIILLFLSVLSLFRAGKRGDLLRSHLMRGSVY